MSPSQKVLPSLEAPDTGSPDVEVSVVMPCLNEARTLGCCIQKARSALDRLGICGEVVVADNGSSDGSLEVALAHGARVVAVPRKGYGSAVRGGIAAARGQFIIMGDADDSYDFGEIGPFVKRLLAGDDLVVGNRFKGGIRPGAMPWHHRYLGNPLLTGLLNLFFRTPIGDAHCGLRGFRKDACQKLALATDGMEFASEMVVKAAQYGLKMSEVPIVLHPDGRDRPPHLRSFRDGWRHLRFLLLMSPHWLFLIPAVFLLLLGGAGAALGGLGAPGWGPPLLAVVCVAASAQALWLWIFARLFGRSGGWLEHLTLERGLVLGTGLVLSGSAVLVWTTLSGNETGTMAFDFTAANCWVCGAGLLLLGAQALFNAFFLEVLRSAVPARPEGERAPEPPAVSNRVDLPGTNGSAVP
jgi:glycosyltransferase involved in cell wall biosynthesis